MSMYDPVSVKRSLISEADLLETTAGAAGIFGGSRNYQNRSITDRVRGVLASEGYGEEDAEQVIAAIEDGEPEDVEEEEWAEDIGAVAGARPRFNKKGKGKSNGKNFRKGSTFRPTGILRRKTTGLTLNSGKNAPTDMNGAVVPSLKKKSTAPNSSSTARPTGKRLSIREAAEIAKNRGTGAETRSCHACKKIGHL